MNTTGSAGIVGQGAQDIQGKGNGQQHHIASMADRISEFETKIAKAATDGKLTSDQAATIKKQLDAISTTLKNTASSGTQLSPQDLQQIRQQIQIAGKDLFYAINPNAPTDIVPVYGSATALFARINANDDGQISQDEFSKFVSTGGVSQNGSSGPAKPDEPAAPIGPIDVTA